MAFVLKATCKHIRRCIDVSIHKTNARWAEFKDTPKSVEVMTTLMKLHSLRALLDDFQKANAADFKEEKND